jgi:hypothetical protein
MYGCDIEKFRESLEQDLRSLGPARMAMSLMSDAQEEISHGLTNVARQTINRAKWIIAEYMMKERV